MWRHKDWKNPWDEKQWEINPVTLQCSRLMEDGIMFSTSRARLLDKFLAYESGADAMLGAVLVALVNKELKIKRKGCIEFGEAKK